MIYQPRFGGINLSQIAQGIGFGRQPQQTQLGPQRFTTQDWGYQATRPFQRPLQHAGELSFEAQPMADEMVALHEQQRQVPVQQPAQSASAPGWMQYLPMQLSALGGFGRPSQMPTSVPTNLPYREPMSLPGGGDWRRW